MLNDENIELALQVFERCNMMSVLDFGLCLSPSKVPKGARRKLKVRRLHVSKSLVFKEADLQDFWVSAKYIAVHKAGLLTIEKVNKWDVMEETVVDGGFDQMNGFSPNRGAVKDSFLKFHYHN